MTLNVTSRGAWLAPVAIVAATYAAGFLGNLAAGPELAPQSPAVRVGEARAAGDVEVKPTPATWASPRPTPTRAARSRPTAAPTHSRILSCTCYVATGNRTASGAWPRPGMAASNHYAFGTRLHVEGVGIVTVTDRIGHSSDLDLFFTSRSECISFGRRSLQVEVVR